MKVLLLALVVAGFVGACTKKEAAAPEVVPAPAAEPAVETAPAPEAIPAVADTNTGAPAAM